MADIPDEISIGEQSTVSIPNLSIQSSNLTANFNCSEYPKPLRILIECLKNSEIARAMTIQRVILQRLVNMAFSKAIYMKTDDMVSFEALGGKVLHIKKKSFIRLMGFSTTSTFVTPSAEQLINMFNPMGFTPFMTKIFQFKKNKLPFIWNFYFTMFKRCLCGRKSGLDAGSQLFLTTLYGIYYNVDVHFGSILWYEFIESLMISTKATELSSHRFWYVIVHTAYTLNKIQYVESEEPKMIFHEYQAPGKIPIQKEFDFVGTVPESMLGRIPMDYEVLRIYKSKTTGSFQIREIPDSILNEIQVQSLKPSFKRKEIEGSSQAQIVLNKKRTKKPKSTSKVLDDEDGHEMLEVSQTETQTNEKEVVESEMPQKKKRSKLRKMVLVDEEEETETVGADVDNVGTEEVDTEVENEKVVTYLSFLKQPEDVHVGSEQHIKNIAEERIQNLETVVSEAIHTTESESLIFKDLQNLNVSIPTDSPNIPPVAEEAPILENLDDETYIALSEDEVFELAPIQNDDDEDDDANDDQFISMKQYKIMNHKLNMLIRYQDLPKKREIQKEAEIEFVVLDFHAKIEAQSSVLQKFVNDFDVFQRRAFSEMEEVKKVCNDMKNKIQHLKETAMKSDDKFGILRDEVLHSQGLFENSFQKRMDGAKLREDKLQKIVDDSFAHIKVLEASIKTYDEKELAKEYNEKVVKHVEMVQQDIVAKLNPLINDMKNKIQHLKETAMKSDDKFGILRDEVLHSQGLFENAFQKRMDGAKLREDKLQKIVDDSFAHIKVLEASIKTYDEKELAKEYNEKVVKHVEMVQQDIVAKLNPLINFVSRIPKTKEDNSTTAASKQFLKIDMPLFKSIVEGDLLISVNPTTTMEPKVISQELFYSVISQQLPDAAIKALDAAIKALDAAKRFSKGIFIQQTIPQFTTSTIVSTHGEGSRLSNKGKGKEVEIELSKEERKKKEADEIEKMKQHLSLIRQGESIDMLSTLGVTKIWTKETIRNVAFGEGKFYNMLPHESYEVDLARNQQLDLPLILKLFKIKCFMVKASLKLLSADYEEKLIKFYGCVGKPENEIWSSKPIARVVQITNAEVFDGVFENKSFKVMHTDNVEYNFTMADFPTMNPSDLIKLFKLFSSVEKIDVIMILNHLRKLLKAYVETFAEKDMMVSKELYRRLDKPNIYQSGISKEKDGRIIHKPDCGVVSSAKVKEKIVKNFLRIDEKGLFDNAVLESILRRINQNDENSVKEKREVEDQLRWWIVVRKEILDLARVLFAKGI